MTFVDECKKFSKAPLVRMTAMQSVLRELDEKKIEGDFVECGVWRGGHVMLARATSPDRVCWLYDTFEGMTKPGPRDRKRSGNKPPPDKALSKKWTMASLEEVRENLRSHGLLDESRLRFVVGDVCETLRRPENVPERIALLRLDTDWYESTRAELEILWPKLVTGGAVFVDDYGHWMGCREACDEFFRTAQPSYVSDMVETDYACVYFFKK